MPSVIREKSVCAHQRPTLPAIRLLRVQWRGQQEAAITAARELEERHLLGLRDSAGAASRPMSANSNGAQSGEKDGGGSGTRAEGEGAKTEETTAAPVHTKHTLQPTVYDAARELLKNHVEEKEAQEAQQKQKEAEEVGTKNAAFTQTQLCLNCKTWS